MLCRSFSSRLLSTQSLNVQPEDFIEGLRQRLLVDSASSTWDRVLSATLIYLLLSLTLRPAQDAQGFICDFRGKLLESSRTRQGAGFYLLWLLITDIESLKIDDPGLVWILTRALWIMAKLRPITRLRLDQFFCSVLFGHHHGLHPRGCSMGETDTDAIDFSSLEAEIRQELR